MHNPKFENYLDHPVTKRLLSPGPKRILALDGGGIRGALTLGFLEKIEHNLRERFSNPSYVLSNYFDLIGGTSTGSIIAAMLAQGRTVEEIKIKYLQLGDKIFGKLRKPWVKGPLRYFLRANYDVTILEDQLDEQFGETTLGSQDLKTGLCIITRRADTFSTWIFHNHPRGAYYEKNKGILLKNLTRASSAAPSYFEPKELEIGDNEIGIFIDGGVSSSNNPALMMLMMTTLKGYPFHWKTGEDSLLIVSIGTGFNRPKVKMKDRPKLKTKASIFWAKDIPDLFMTDATFFNQMILQYISNPAIPEKINSEAGFMKSDLLNFEPVVSYVRYSTLLQRTDLNQLGFQFDEEEMDELRKMDNGQNAKLLSEIGKKSAIEKVQNNHFSRSFDFIFHHRDDGLVSQDQMLTKFKSIIEKHGQVYVKYRPIYARQVEQSETVVSITSDGEETFSEASPGDYIIRNQTEYKEIYAVSAEKFNARYTKIRGGKEGWDEYKPKGSLIGIELTEEIAEDLDLNLHFLFQAPWGEKQYCTHGDFLVKPHGEDEIYRINRNVFYQTYTLQ